MNTCASCGKEIHVGHDCYQVAKGVMGTREFINLEHKLFCSEECLDVEVADDESSDDESDTTPRIPRTRRVP